MSQPPVPPRNPPDPRLEATFGPRAAGPAPVLAARPPVRPEVSPPVAEAFGRSADSSSLQRHPEMPAPPPVPPRPEPWRDPQAAVRLGPPVEDDPVEVPPVVELERFTLRDALFHRRLRPGAVVGLLVLCLLVGAAGAVTGTLLGSRIPAAANDPDFTLTPLAPPGDRPVGSVADIASRVLPAVVSIEVRIGDGGGSGSGVVIDPAGYILTNNHVVSMAADNPDAQLSVVFDDGAGTRAPATLVGRDPGSDLAVLQVTGENLTVAQLGSSAQVRVGDPVVAVGSPLGLSGTVTTGIVSAVQRPVRLQGGGTDTNAVIDAIQTDAAINPGNSGGALIDETGAVIGINTAIRTLGTEEAAGSIGLGFAIPIDDARVIAEELIRSGSVAHPTLGINARSATDGAADGAQVANVAADSPAARAGIVEGDIIVRVGDRRVADADGLVVAQQQYAVGETVEVEVVRAGRSMVLTAVLAAT